MMREALREMTKILRAAFSPAEKQPPSRSLKQALDRLDQETEAIRRQVVDANSEVLLQMLERIQ